MHRSYSTQALSPLSTPSGSTLAPAPVKRRKSYQWILGSRNPTPENSRPSSPQMPQGAATLQVPNPARVMLERRHSYQSSSSRIPRYTKGAAGLSKPGSSLSKASSCSHETQAKEATVAEDEGAGSRSNRSKSPNSSYSDSSEDEASFPDKETFTNVALNEDFSFDASSAVPDGKPTFNLNPFGEKPAFNLNPFDVPGEDLEAIVRRPSVRFQEVSPHELPERTQSMSAVRPPSPYVPTSRRGSAKWTERLRTRTGSLQPSPAVSRNPSFTDLGAARRPSLMERVRSPQLTPSMFSGSRALGSFSNLYEGTAFYVKPTGRELPSPSPLPGPRAPSPPAQRKHGRYAHRVPRAMDEAIDFSRIRCPVPVPASKAPILQHEETEAQALSDAYMGRSYGVIGQADPDNDDGTAEDEDDRTVYSDVEIASGESGDDGYAYGGIPAAYEFVDPEIPCVVPAVASAPMSSGEEQLLHHSMAHPWVVPPYNAPERSRRSARESTWRSLEATLGAVVASALLLPFGAGFMVINIGSFGVGSFGLLMIADFAFRAGAASLNRRRVNNVTKNSPIAKGYETYTTLPRMNRPRLPECNITVVGYRENQQLWEDCLESIKAQQYPVKHIVSVIDGNDPADVAMATTFANAFPEKDRLVVHLPVLLSVLYVDRYNDTLRMLGQVPTRFESFKAWMTGQPTAGHTAAHESALNYVLDYLYTKAAIGKWSHHKALCFTQPHAHKRHAMFTAFFVGTYVLGTKDALLTTDSDTRLEPSAASNLMAMLFSEDDIAAVTGDVDVDRRASLLPNVYALNNWFASNVDSPCQSFFGSVSRLSSPMALYRVSDLMEIVSPWIMQTHFGRDATIGEDRHLATLLLSRGLKTAHTHAAKAFTEAPGRYVRWVKQQTRWSRAMYREGLFSSPRVNTSNPWLAIEATTALYYPAVLMASMLYLLFTPHQWEHLVIWLSTVGAAIVLKTVYAIIVGRDVRLLLYPLYQVLFFLGVVPTRAWALLTTHSNKWGTSARSMHEISRSESFLSRTTHTGYLLLWYTALSVGLGYYLATALAKPALWAVALVGLVPALHAYADVAFAKFNFFVFAPRHIQQGRTKVSDVEAYPQAAAKRRFSVPKLSLKGVGRGSVVSDKQFEEDMAAIPLNSSKKDGSLFGEASITVFEAPDSRRPSLFTAVTDSTPATTPSPVTPLPLAVPELPFRKPAFSPALDVRYGEAY